MIVFFTYFICVVLLVGYIAWFVVRYRRDQRNKAMESEIRLPPSSAGLLDPRPVSSPAPSPPPSASPSASPAAPSSSPAASESQGGARTVAQALTGISMPHDLVPMTSMPVRAGVIDQVAFSSRSSVSVIGPLFADELERLGYAVTPLDDKSLVAKRGDDNLIVHIHPEPPAGVSEGVVVIEVCIPF